MARFCPKCDSKMKHYETVLHIEAGTYCTNPSCENSKAHQQKKAWEEKYE